MLIDKDGNIDNHINIKMGHSPCCKNCISKNGCRKAVSNAMTKKRETAKKGK